MTDPVGFNEQCLGGFLWSKQREICKSVLVNRRTAVPSAHDTGKSATASRLVAWWLACHPPGHAFVVTIAPTYNQVRGILWREINRIHLQGGLPGHLNQTEWWMGTEMVGFGRSPRDTDPTTLQGIHAAYVLAIIDEACGIGAELFDAIDTLITNEGSRILAIGNPDDPDTRFGSVCRPGSGWHVIQVDALESPNFTAEQVPDWLRPLLVSPIWVDEKRRTWGENSPIFQSKVRGRFAEESDDALVPLRALRSALNRKLEDVGPSELGCDVARFGGDATVIYHRRGPVVRRLVKTTNRDLMHVVGLCINAVKDTNATRLKIDDTGLGGGVVDRLQENYRHGQIPATCTIEGINVGEAPSSVEADARFRRLKDELNWNMRDIFISGQIQLAGSELDNQELLAQASQIKYRLTSSGEIELEKKYDMKKRTGASPDDWDALVLCFGNTGSDLSVWARL